MISYDKTEIRNNLTNDQIFELLTEWGGDPEYASFGIISSTICHNRPGDGSRKLYYYYNTKLCHCYTGCPEPSFDIFELLIKIFKIQKNKDLDLNDAVRYIAQKFGIFTSAIADDDAYDTEEWKVFEKYDRLQKVSEKEKQLELKTYDRTILSRLNYNVELYPWLKEGITQTAIDDNLIGFYPGGDQITIPHFDKDGNFIGLRGRTMCKEEAERYGKYRPVRVGKDLYNHPLGLNLYNLNNSKENIKITKRAIVFESEKSCLLYQSYFGKENDISVACCGSNLSTYQVQLLIDAGAREIIVAFDRQFQEINDEEYHHLTSNYEKIYNKYKNYLTISFIFDKNMITGYKDAPIDCGKEIFIKLFKDRIYLK